MRLALLALLLASGCSPVLDDGATCGSGWVEFERFQPDQFSTPVSFTLAGRPFRPARYDSSGLPRGVTDTGMELLTDSLSIVRGNGVSGYCVTSTSEGVLVIETGAGSLPHYVPTYPDAYGETSLLFVQKVGDEYKGLEIMISEYYSVPGQPESEIFDAPIGIAVNSSLDSLTFASALVETSPVFEERREIFEYSQVERDTIFLDLGFLKEPAWNRSGSPAWIRLRDSLSDASER